MSGPAIHGFEQAAYKIAKAIGDVLPRVSVVLDKPAKATTTASDAAVAAMDAPADFIEELAATASAEPAVSDTTGFNF